MHAKKQQVYEYVHINMKCFHTVTCIIIHTYWKIISIVMTVWAVPSSPSCAVIHDLTSAVMMWNFWLFVSNVWSQPWMVHDGSTDILAVISFTCTTLLQRCQCLMFLIWSELYTGRTKGRKKKQTNMEQRGIFWVWGSEHGNVRQIKWGMLKCWKYLRFFLKVTLNNLKNLIR